MERICCPFHDEATPSCVIYHDHYRCYGCGATGPLADLGGDISRRVRVAVLPVDLASDLARIEALPRASVRGLSLPVDGDSFFIVWPGGTYYKRRKFFPGDGPKYICPRGHKKPLFVPWKPERAATLAVVEGELNALSIASLEPPFAVCSPGGVGDFKESILKDIGGYKRYLLVLDKDEPGLKAGMKMKALLLKRSPYVSLVLMKKDANELLQEGALKSEVERWAKDL